MGFDKIRDWCRGNKSRCAAMSCYSKIVALILLALCGSKCRLVAQDTVMCMLLDNAKYIVSAEVVDVGRKIGGEDGIVRYAALCRIERSFKGEWVANEYFAVEIVEPLTLQSKDSTLAAKSLITIGAHLIFFVSTRVVGQEHFLKESGLREIHALADDWLGIQACTPSMIFKISNLK